MKKVAIFTEGQTELIFIRYLAGIEFGWDKISVRCISLARSDNSLAGLNCENPQADFLFQIIEVGNDEGVLSKIKELEKRLLKSGFEKIFGLRDIYSEAYLKRVGRKIVPDIINRFIESTMLIVQNMSSPDKVKFHFAIMEVEAWFLGICNIFEKINTKLTVQYIAEKLQFNLDEIDPQEKFVRPSEKVNQIFQLIGRKYDKSRGDVEIICREIDRNDIQAILESNRCQSFKGFYTDITSF